MESLFDLSVPQIIFLSCPLYSQQVAESVFAGSGGWFSDLSWWLPRVSDSVNLGWVPRICISNFPGGAAAAGPNLHFQSYGTRATGLIL